MEAEWEKEEQEKIYDFNSETKQVMKESDNGSLEETNEENEQSPRSLIRGNQERYEEKNNNNTAPQE